MIDPERQDAIDAYNEAIREYALQGIQHCSGLDGGDWLALTALYIEAMDGPDFDDALTTLDRADYSQMLAASGDGLARAFFRFRCRVASAFTGPINRDLADAASRMGRVYASDAEYRRDHGMVEAGQ